jgi:hypothetical protein
METTVIHWTKVARNAQAVSFTDFFRGLIVYKEKWVTINGDYKKLKDYINYWPQQRLLQDDLEEKKGAYFANQLCELPF